MVKRRAAEEAGQAAEDEEAERREATWVELVASCLAVQRHHPANPLHNITSHHYSIMNTPHHYRIISKKFDLYIHFKNKNQPAGGAFG